MVARALSGGCCSAALARLRPFFVASSAVILTAAPFLAIPALAAAEDARSSTLTATARDDQTTTTDEQIVADIDELIRSGWRSAAVRPSQPATDAEWCRRVFLDVIGRTPRVEELEAFWADRSAHKKRELVDRLLDSDQYVEEYARHFSAIWTNLLIGRAAGLDRRSLVNREGLEQYVRLALLHNKPYDRFVADLVAADGRNKPGEADYNGAVNYLLAAQDDAQGIQATAKTSRLFLGLQIQCTQCHNHPFNDAKQSQFWAMNAFFRQMRPLRTLDGDDIVSVRLADQDFAGEGGNPEDAEIYYELRTQELAIAYPTFVDGTTIPKSGFVEDVNRRDELAKLIVGSEYLSRAIVNRMWSQFLGYGFTKPVDDMGPHNAVSHPELLDRLARAFVARGHDLKSLVRWITLCEAYSLSSRLAEKKAIDDPEAGEPPLFSRFYVRQMSAEQLYESLLSATGAKQVLSEADRERVRREWLSQFVIAFGNDENGEATTFNGTITQTLMMMNGELTKQATECKPGSFLHEVATSDAKDDAKVRQLYLAALARQPNGRELKLAQELRRARGGDMIGALADVWWALLNSNEFLLNH